MIPQSTPLYAVEAGSGHATLHLVVAWDHSPPIPLAVTLASTQPGPHSTDAQPLGTKGITYYDDRTEARTAFESAKRTNGHGSA